VEKSPAPPLLPIFRSQQQAEILALLLGDPDLELSITEIADRTGVPYPSVHREIERAEAAGLVTSRRIGNTRLVRVDTDRADRAPREAAER
jgi:DNA-binding transcriptional ArsR family regulator